MRRQPTIAVTEEQELLLWVSVSRKERCCNSGSHKTISVADLILVVDTEVPHSRTHRKQLARFWLGHGLVRTFPYTCPRGIRELAESHDVGLTTTVVVRERERDRDMVRTLVSRVL